MQIIGPLGKFYFKHSDDFEAIEAEQSGPSNVPMMLDFVTALGPFIKKYWPKLNRNNLVDDFIAMLHEMFA